MCISFGFILASVKNVNPELHYVLQQMLERNFIFTGMCYYPLNMRRVGEWCKGGVGGGKKNNGEGDNGKSSTGKESDSITTADTQK